MCFYLNSLDGGGGALFMRNSQQFNSETCINNQLNGNAYIDIYYLAKVNIVRKYECVQRELNFQFLQ